MPLLKVWVHAVWSTQQRKPTLIQSIRPIVFSHMIENGRKKGLLIDRINGHIDHVHMLFALTNDQPISKVIQLVKGESSHWINQRNLMSSKFEWQDEYYAASVSESSLNAVQLYIDHQEEHHKQGTFVQEYEHLMQSVTSDGKEHP